MIVVAIDEMIGVDETTIENRRTVGMVGAVTVIAEMREEIRIIIVTEIVTTVSVTEPWQRIIPLEWKLM